MTDTNDRNKTIGGESTFVGADEPANLLEPGTVLKSKYKLIEQIGRGGMGVVWSAQDQTAKRKVVLKFVPREIDHFESAVAQVMESFQKIHELHHQHICPVYGLEDDRALGYYLVMKWLDGETLDRYVARTVGFQKPLPRDEVMRILKPVAEALDYAHKHVKKIIHRDIKPSNIFLVLDEAKNIRDVQVIDFGLASEIRSTLTRVSQIRFDNSGTRPYMAPEQWRGNRRLQTGATDQYALGVVAYELLSGDLPFEADDTEMLRLMVLQDTPEPIAEQPEHVNAALSKALSKDRKDRYVSCREFVDALNTRGIAIQTPSVTIQIPEPEPVKTPSGKQAGDRMVLTIKDVEYPFRWCPAGTFMMGSPASEPERFDNETQHEVTLTRGFWMLETQVTQEMWEGVMGKNPSHFKGGIFKSGKRLPVESVSWEDCQTYIAWLNTLNEESLNGYRVSLPTESQWEYACRAGTTTAFHFGKTLNGDKANCDGNNPYGMAKGQDLQKTTNVGSYPANAWGLYDMHGNVWEWCQDWYDKDYPIGSVTDPVGASTGSLRVLRGGGWDFFAGFCRSAGRFFFVPSFRGSLIGLRLSLVREE